MITQGYIAKWNQYPEEEIKIRVTRPSILAPSKELLEDYKKEKINWTQYQTRYVEEITGKPEAIKKIKEIIELGKENTVRLICYEKEYPCHRFILLAIIKMYQELEPYL